jgi:N-acyl amino acid synthase of PEP-CTERM/exosortase system
MIFRPGNGCLDESKSIPDSNALFTFSFRFVTLTGHSQQDSMNNPSMQPDLLSAFNEYFELVHANTDELRAQVFQLRYQVYVLETGFEAEQDCRRSVAADGQVIRWEEDEFDVRSDHYLLRHRRTGVYAATTRLILPESRTSTAPYPIELHCKLDERVTEPSLRRQLGEISRFAVSKSFKRRLGEAGSIAGVASNIEVYFDDDERRVLPHISLGLFAAVIRMMHAHEVSLCYAVMEPALVRLMGRFGVVFKRIGPDVNYHGVRVPCLSTVSDSLPNIKQTAPQVWELMTNRGEFFREAA